MMNLLELKRRYHLPWHGTFWRTRYGIWVWLAAFLITLAGPQGIYAKMPPQNGVQKEYYPDGRLRVENYFKKGLLVRKRTYHKNGKVLLDSRYKNGVAIVKRTYYDNGVLKSEWTRRSGQTKYYYPDGKLRVVVSDAPQPVSP